jgi:hypothetical protein
MDSTSTTMTMMEKMVVTAEMVALAAETAVAVVVESDK